jgi:hypothetical protein
VSDSIATTGLRTGRRRIARPPFPHEHGAWAMLYSPLIIAVAAFPPIAWLPVTLLTIAVTGLFLARNAFSLIVRRRADTGTAFWLSAYLCAAAAAAYPLLISSYRADLLFIGIVAAGLLAVHTLLLLIPAQKRLDRSQWGEILAVGALTLTAPAAYIVVHGHLATPAWRLWISCTLFFSSSIFFVKMLLNAVKVKGAIGRRQRWQLGRNDIVYHSVLAIVIVAMVVLQRNATAVLAAAAYVPALVRAFTGWIRLSNKPPPIKRVGLAETAYAVWFTGLYLASLRIGA